jgi:hypothetical protein
MTKNRKDEFMKAQIGTRMMILLGLGVLALTVPAFTQSNQADNMQIVREKLRADKKLLVAQTMQLTDPESQSFWPVYESFQKELTALNDRVLKLIQNYAQNYASMTNEVARTLTDEYMAADAERLKIRQSYLPRFRKVLSEIKVARYYQLETKIQALINYDLATGIPLIQ